MRHFNLDSMQFYSLMVAFIALLFFPSFFYVVMSSTSTALGLFFALFIIFFVTVSRVQFSYKLLSNILIIICSLLSVFFVYSFFAFGFGEYPTDSRVIYSGILIVCIILSSCFFSVYLTRAADASFIKAIRLLAMLALLIGVYSIFSDQNFIGYERYSKSVFPFAEPSHYAITLGPILFSAGFLLAVKFRMALIIFSLFFSIATPSLVMLLFTILMILLYFKWSAIRLAVMGISIPVFLLLLFSSEQGGYFLDRLSFSGSSTNLTALVYMQGWEDMFNALRDSNWLGIGFQNLGILSPGYYGDIIYSLAGEYKNRADGGFLASKIIAEFGVLGVSLIIIYLLFFSKSLLFLFRFIGGDFNNSPTVSVFSNAIIVAFFIELFARGSGYFTPGFFLVLTSFFALSISANMKRTCYE